MKKSDWKFFVRESIHCIAKIAYKEASCQGEAELIMMTALAEVRKYYELDDVIVEDGLTKKKGVKK